MLSRLFPCLGPTVKFTGSSASASSHAYAKCVLQEPERAGSGALVPPDGAIVEGSSILSPFALIAATMFEEIPSMITVVELDALETAFVKQEITATAYLFFQTRSAATFYDQVMLGEPMDMGKLITHLLGHHPNGVIPALHEMTDAIRGRRVWKYVGRVKMNNEIQVKNGAVLVDLEDLLLQEIERAAGSTSPPVVESQVPLHAGAINLAFESVGRPPMDNGVLTRHGSTSLQNGSTRGTQARGRPSRTTSFLIRMESNVDEPAPEIPTGVNRAFMSAGGASVGHDSKETIGLTGLSRTMSFLLGMESNGGSPAVTYTDINRACECAGGPILDHGGLGYGSFKKKLSADLDTGLSKTPRASQGPPKGLMPRMESNDGLNDPTTGGPFHHPSKLRMVSNNGTGALVDSPFSNLKRMSSLQDELCPKALLQNAFSSRPGGPSALPNIVSGIVTADTCAPAAGNWQDVTLLEPANGIIEDKEDGDSNEAFSWHEVTVAPYADPLSGKTFAIISQANCTDLMNEARKAVLTHSNASDTQLDLLSSMFPRHVIEHIFKINQQEIQLSVHKNVSDPNLSLELPTQLEASTNNNIVLDRPHTRVPTKGLEKLARSHEGVTILFMDIVGFTTMSKEVHPEKVMSFLNELFSQFDDLTDKYRVQKIETAGDCYIAAAGILKDDEEGFVIIDQHGNATRNAMRMMQMSKAMLIVSRRVKMPHNNEPALIRIGLHTGDCVTGVVGSKLPKFSVFGDTMNTSSRMESTSIPGHIQVSESTWALLKDREQWRPTGGVEIKGKGLMNTYFWVPAADPMSTVPAIDPSLIGSF